MHKAQELYPLPAEERTAVVKATVLSEAIWLAVALVGGAMLNGLRSDDWLGALALNWLPDLTGALTLHWVALPMTALMVAVAELLQRVAEARSESFRAARRKINQGINGELPRVDLGRICLCMGLAGIAEELVFRYVVIGLLMLGLTQMLPYTAAALATLAIQSVAFWLVHLEYRDPWISTITLCDAAILGAGYLLTNSLLSCMIAHAAYNVITLLLDRRRMVKDPNYFGGPAPTSYVRDLSAK